MCLGVKQHQLFFIDHIFSSYNLLLTFFTRDNKAVYVSSYNPLHDFNQLILNTLPKIWCHTQTYTNTELAGKIPNTAPPPSQLSFNSLHSTEHIQSRNYLQDNTTNKQTNNTTQSTMVTVSTCFSMENYVSPAAISTELQAVCTWFSYYHYIESSESKIQIDFWCMILFSCSLWPRHFRNTFENVDPSEICPFELNLIH